MYNRRNFLKQSGKVGLVGLAIPSIVPASVFGKNAPSNQVNVGMIATGRQAINVNLKQFLGLENVRVVAVNDVDHWRMQQAADIINQHYSQQVETSYNGVKKYQDYRELLGDPEVDAVMVSSPDHWHVSHGVAAAIAGKHVSMEKALTTSINHSQALLDAVNSNHVHHRLDSEFRSQENFSRAVGLVRSGAIGELEKVVVGVPSPLNGSAVGPQPNLPVPEELDYDQWLGPAFPAPYTVSRVHARHKYNVRPGWMRIDDYCNGMITNWGAHVIDIALWGMDKERESPVSVEGTGQFTSGLWNTIEAFNLNYTFADGTILEYIIDDPYIKFIGADGWIKAGFKKETEASDPEILKGKIPQQFQNIQSDKQDFINAIVNDQPTLEPLEVGHNVYRLTNMGLLSVKLGRKLEWDPQQKVFRNDNAANAMLWRPVREKYLDKPVVDWLNKYAMI